MTVYLVTAGNYDDYRVKGAFSSQEKAQPYVDYLNAKDPDDAQIEPFELDSKEPRPLKTLYVCHFELYSDGSLRHTTETVDADYFPEDSADTFYSDVRAAAARAKAVRAKAAFILEHPSKAAVWPVYQQSNHDLMTC